MVTAISAARIRPYFFLKVIGTTVFMVLFFQGYFATLEHPVRAVTLMPEGPVDRLISFQTWTIPIYCSLWVYVTFPAMLLTKGSQLVRFTVAAAGLALLGLLIFAVWPTAVVTQGTGFLKTVDRGGNACPSLHAAYTVFTALVLHRLFRAEPGTRWLRIANLLWCVAILYSTLATKQHVFTDLTAGIALGALFAAVALEPGQGWATSVRRPAGG